MEGETIALNHCSESRRSRDSISILVVDDDITCLSIVAAILKKFKYGVVTVKHPSDALCTLRVKGDAIHLVVSDVHMPDMSGFELQEAIAHEFNLPVVLMSADKEVESGAAFFIPKPVSPDDLRDLWQFAAMKKRNQVVIEEAGNDFPAEISNSFDEMHVSASTVNGGTHNKKDSKRKSPGEEESDHERRGDNRTQSASTKKPKVVWTNALHTRFLEAIRSIGLERCVPKKILEVMNVPGLTRENVASHLQKYRIFLRRVSDASYKIYNADNKGSSFAASGTSHSILMPNSLSKPHYQNLGHFPGANTASLPNQGAFSSSCELIAFTGSLLKPNIEGTNLVHQNSCQSNRSSARLAQNNYQTSPLIQGHHSIACLEGHTDSFDAPILGSTRINMRIRPEVPLQVGTSNVVSSLASINSAHQMNYAGFKVSNIKHLAEPGSCEEYEGLSSRDGTLNLHSNYEFQNNSTVGAAALPSDNILNLDETDWYLGGSSCYMPDNFDGTDLSDYNQNLLLSSNLSLLPNLENEGPIHESAFSPMFDLSAFDIMPTPQPLGECDHDICISDQVNIQNQAQQNGGENTDSSGFHGGTNNWDNHFSSYDQAPNQQQVQDLTNSGIEYGASSQFINSLLSPNEDGDDFLESLLAFGPFGQDQIQTLEGI